MLHLFYFVLLHQNKITHTFVLFCVVHGFYLFQSDSPTVHPKSRLIKPASPLLPDAASEFRCKVMIMIMWYLPHMIPTLPDVLGTVLDVLILSTS